MRPAHRLFLWPMQGLALALFWSCCAATTPERAAAMGARLGRFIGPRLHWHRRLRDNLTVALPHAAAEQVEGIAREVWGSFGATLAEYAHFEAIADRAFDGTWRSFSIPASRRATAMDGRSSSSPPISATGTSRRPPRAHLGLPLTVVYSRRPTRSPTGWCSAGAEASGAGSWPTDDGMRPLLHDLRAGRSIGLLVDLRVESGDAVPFCGQDTTTTLVPARLALKFGCPLVPVRVERLRPAHLRVTLYDPVLPDGDLAPEAQAWEMMAKVNALFESWIVERPHEWQCFQNRWPRSTRRQRLQTRTPGAGGP